MYLGLKNSEGYYDLTAYEAIKNTCEEENYYTYSLRKGSKKEITKMALKYRKETSI